MASSGGSPDTIYTPALRGGGGNAAGKCFLPSCQLPAASPRSYTRPHERGKERALFSFLSCRLLARLSRLRRIDSLPRWAGRSRRCPAFSGGGGGAGRVGGEGDGFYAFSWVSFVAIVSRLGFGCGYGVCTIDRSACLYS